MPVACCHVHPQPSRCQLSSGWQMCEAWKKPAVRERHSCPHHPPCIRDRAPHQPLRTHCAGAATARPRGRADRGHAAARTGLGSCPPAGAERLHAAARMRAPVRIGHRSFCAAAGLDSEVATVRYGTAAAAAGCTAAGCVAADCIDATAAAGTAACRGRRRLPGPCGDVRRLRSRASPAVPGARWCGRALRCRRCAFQQGGRRSWQNLLQQCHHALLSRFWPVNAYFWSTERLQETRPLHCAAGGARTEDHLWGQQRQEDRRPQGLRPGLSSPQELQPCSPAGRYVPNHSSVEKAQPLWSASEPRCCSRSIDLHMAQTRSTPCGFPTPSMFWGMRVCLAGPGTVCAW